MPEILVGGKPRKFACEPCIRGHRSSKCQHHDRTLVEVRKPGRPLSTCPHVGSHCTCDRLRLALPRKSSCACGPTVSSADSAAPPPVFGSSSDAATVGEQRTAPALLSGTGTTSAPHRVQKSSKRRTSAMVIVPESIAAANRTRVSNAPQQNAIVGNIMGPPGSSFALGQPSMLPSHVPFPSNFAFGHPSAVDQRQPYSTPDPDTSASNTPSEQPPVRLGLMGSGGFPAIKDEAGWTRNWSNPFTEPSTRPASTNTEHQSKPAGGCCGSKRASSRTSAASPPLPRDYATPGLSSSTAVQPNSRDQSTLSQQQQDAVISSESSSRSSSSLRSSNIPSEPYTLPSSYTSSYQALPNLPGIAPGQLGPFLSDATNHTFPPGSTTYPMQTSKSMLENHGHDCNCGDTCNCLACPTHPYNDTSVKFAESIYDFMLNENHYDVSDSDSPTGPLPELSGEAGCCKKNATPVQAQQSPAELQSTVSTTPQPLNNLFGSDPQNFRSDSQATILSVDGSEPQSGLYDPLNGYYGDEPQLVNSPSLYYHLEYPLKVECSNEAGSCQCGDGCSCTGCFTHHGHTGVPLEPLSMSMFDSVDLGMDMQNPEWQSSPFSTSAFSRL